MQGQCCDVGVHVRVDLDGVVVEGFPGLGVGVEAVDVVHACFYAVEEEVYCFFVSMQAVYV